MGPFTAEQHKERACDLVAISRRGATGGNPATPRGKARDAGRAARAADNEPRDEPHFSGCRSQLRDPSPSREKPIAVPASLARRLSRVTKFERSRRAQCVEFAARGLLASGLPLRLHVSLPTEPTNPAPRRGSAMPVGFGGGLLRPSPIVAVLSTPAPSERRRRGRSSDASKGPGRRRRGRRQRRRQPSRRPVR
jgi:hypothetical protein